MISSTDIAKIFDTVLSIPGMNEPVKITLSMPRKNVLLLAKIIERGLNAKDDQATGSLLTVVGNEALNGLQGITSEMLHKAGLTDMNEKLNSIASK